MALSNAINHGQVQDAGDLAQYTKLTTGTLWALAQNEYGSGNWQRAAELFDRYQHEAPSADAASLTRAEFLQADCYYQMHQVAQAEAAYEAALKEHPFHPLAPGARLRLYHLDIVAGHPEQAQQELEAMVWTVRTAWPQDEVYWQRKTAELLLALNRTDSTMLPPLIAKSAQLAAQDKAWQADLGHYDRLANLEATIPQAALAPADASAPRAKARGLGEQDDLAAMQQSIDALAPPKISDHP
jgi:tetratricopeptide (TPR) repeat protein